jgi:hypothetical protein
MEPLSAAVTEDVKETANNKVTASKLRICLCFIFISLQKTCIFPVRLIISAQNAGVLNEKFGQIRHF